MKKSNWKAGLELFWVFMKIGCFTFGSGWSVLAQLEEEYINKRQMITKEELLELTAVGKSVPGIMITNVSMLMGYTIAGWFGGVCAVVGLTLPAIFILTIVTYFYSAIKGNPWFGYAMRGIGGCVVAIIGSAAWSLGKEGLKDALAFAICGVTFALCLFTGVSNVLLVGAGVAAALIWFGLDHKKKEGTEK